MEIAGYQISDEIVKNLAEKIDFSADVFPPEDCRFRALEMAPLKSVKVVVLGQDPYHGESQANGLSFSVNRGQKLPPSLRNIYKEIERDLHLPMPVHGDLTPWAKQGVLMLNAVLSVEKAKPNSHAGLGWEDVTDSIISQINENCEGVIFLLWGAYAQKKKGLIDSLKHHVLETTHPSPFSAHKGFLGCGHFSKVNDILKSRHQKEIDWELPVL